MDETFLKVTEVHKAMDTLKYISADDEIRAIADLRTINDKNSEITTAKEEGITEGITIGEAKGKAEGKAEGAMEKAKEAAVKMLAENLSLEIVAKCTGLSVEEIRKLQANGKLP